MAWLRRQGEVLASLEVGPAKWRRRRRRSAPGVGAVLIPRRRAHSFGARRAVDVAYLDADLVVVATSRLAPNRLGLPHRGVCSILEAEAGAFERWRLRPGDRLEIEE